MADERKNEKKNNIIPISEVLKERESVDTQDQSAYSREIQDTSGSGGGGSSRRPPSNGFVARYLDLSLLNRIFKTFPMERTDEEYVKKLVENFPNEQGAFVVAEKPYMTQSYIPQVEGFLEYQVKNEMGTGFSDEGYRQRRKAFVWCSSVSPYSRQLQFWEDAYKFSQENKKKMFIQGIV